MTIWQPVLSRLVLPLAHSGSPPHRLKQRRHAAPQKNSGGNLMEQIVQYIKPELLIVSVILYFIGIWLKQAQTVKDKYIPLILGGLGIALCAVWVLATSPLRTGPEIAMAAFTAIVQGVLVAGLSTYVNQIIKQAGK